MTSKKSAALLCRHDPRHGPTHPHHRRRLSPGRYGTDSRSQRPLQILEKSCAVDVEENWAAAEIRVVEGRTPSSAQRGEALQPTMQPTLTIPTKTKDQSANWRRKRRTGSPPEKPTASAKPYNSIENIAEFFASRGKKSTGRKRAPEEPTGKRGFRPGQKVRHPKYGEGTVYQARRRRRRSQDYCTISSLRLEEAGREVRAVGARVI